MNIPIAKPYLTHVEAQSAYDAILGGWVTQGPRVADFERAFADYTGARFAVAVSSCTTALHLAMIVMGIRHGDEVICPSLSYIATANSIKYVGAQPVFAEVESDDYNMSVRHAETLINKNTKAVLVVHQLGMPADLIAFGELCRRYGLVLIEDAACASGSAYNGVKIGARSDIACFSFHPRKVITTGDGGMITTNNESRYQRLKLLRQHGMSLNDRDRHVAGKLLFEEHLEIGYNYRMTDIQAAVGLEQLKKLDWIVAERRKIAEHYRLGFQDISCLRLPRENAGCFANYQSYSIYLLHHAPLSRNELMDKLFEKGIATRRGVMTAHREKAYRREYSGLSLPISEDLSDRSFLLPLYVPMTSAEQDYVIANVRELLPTNK